MPDTKIILLLGDIHQGFTAFGPFDSREDARVFREKRMEWAADYMELIPPPEEKDNE